MFEGKKTQQNKTTNNNFNKEIKNKTEKNYIH